MIKQWVARIHKRTLIITQLKLFAVWFIETTGSVIFTFNRNVIVVVCGAGAFIQFSWKKKPKNEKRKKNAYPNHYTYKVFYFNTHITCIFISSLQNVNFPNL